MPSHGLIPDSIEIPELYATQNEDDPPAVVKLFTPDSSWTWYVVGFDPVERLCFGLVVGHDRELGYFSLDELETARGPLGLNVERDLYFESTPVSECR